MSPTDLDQPGSGGGLRYLNEQDSRHMVNQERWYSCQVACARQLLRDAKVDIAEAVLLDKIGYHEGYGTTAEQTALVLSELHPEWTFNGGSIPIEGISELFQKGAWIANVRTDRGKIHAVIVDRLEADIVHVRDPWGTSGPGLGRGTAATIGLNDFLDHWHWALNKAVIPARRKQG